MIDILLRRLLTIFAYITELYILYKNLQNPFRIKEKFARSCIYSHMKTKKPRHSLLYGTALLFASNVLVKGLGFGYRVALVRLLGTEGVGLVEMITPIYSFLLVLAGLGLQPALAQKVAAQDEAAADASFGAAWRLLLISGLTVTAAGFVCSPLLAQGFAADQRICPGLLAVLPAVFIVSLASGWRGWFHGRRELGVLGMSQNVEQAVRVILGLWLVKLLRPAGLARDAAGVSLATVGGELAGYLYLALLGNWRRRGRRVRDGWHKAVRPLLAYGLPMTGGRLVNSLLLMLQAFLIPYCLQRGGCSVAAATEIYGRFSGVALTLLHLPGVFASALATAVMPAAAANCSRPETLRRYIARPLQAVLICTLPGMALLYLYAEPLCSGLFNNAQAAPVLRLLAPGGIFFYMQMILAGVLQGLGDVKQLLLNNALSGCLLLVGVALLVPLPGAGINGAAIAMDLAWLCGFLLNLSATSRHLSGSRERGLPWDEILRLPLAAFAAATAVWCLCSSLTTVKAAALAAAAAAYLLIVFFNRGRISL